MEKRRARRHPRGADAAQFRGAFASVDRGNRAERTVAQPGGASRDAAAGPEPGFYHGLLAPQSANIDIWETEYLQVLEGENPVKEWTKGTWLTRYLDVLEGRTKQPSRPPMASAWRKPIRANAAGPDPVPVPAAVHRGAAQGLTMDRAAGCDISAGRRGLERKRNLPIQSPLWLPDLRPRQFGLGLVVRDVVYCLLTMKTGKTKNNRFRRQLGGKFMRKLILARGLRPPFSGLRPPRWRRARSSSSSATSSPTTRRRARAR